MFSSSSPWIHCCQDWQLAHGRSWETIGPQRGAFIVVSMGNLRHWRPRTKSSRSHFSLWSHWIIFWWKRRSRWGKDRSRVNNSNSNSNCNFFSKDHPRAFIFGIGTPCLWNEGFWKGAKVFFFLFFSLYFLVNNNYCSEKKRLKTGEDNSYLLPTPVASMNKIQGIISLSQLFCLALGWHFFKSTSSSSSPSSIDLNWTFKHKKNWYRRLEGISQWWRVNTYRGSWTP